MKNISKKIKPSQAKGIVVYLDEHFLGQNMMEKVEMHRLKVLFDKSMRGLEFYGHHKLQVIELMKELLHLDGVRSLIQLLRILDILSTTKEYHYISSRHYSDDIKEHETDRLNTVYEYIIKNYRNKITIGKNGRYAAHDTYFFQPLFFHEK